MSSVPYNTTTAQWVHSSLTALEPAIANHRAITREVNGQCQVCSNTTSGCDVCGSCCHVCGLGRAWEPVRVRVEDVESDAEYSHPGRVSRGMPKIGQGGLGLGAANRFWGRARAGKNSYDIHVGWWDACSQTRAKKIGGGLRRGSGSSRKPCATFISSAPCLLPEELQIYVHPRNPYQRGLAWPLTFVADPIATTNDPSARTFGLLSWANIKRGKRTCMFLAAAYSFPSSHR